MPRLVVEKGKDKGKVLALRENTPYLVGRDLKTHLRLRDQQVSRRHLKITLKGIEVRLEDLDSSNGSFVNGERVRSLELKPGDKIQVGETLIFYLEDESQDDATAGSGTVSAVEAAAPQAAPSEKARRGELTGRELGGYRLGRLLGRGGMGTVYEAVQVSLDRRVAFKVLARELAADGQFVDRFTAEARAAGQLNHPNIVQVYDVGTAGPIALRGEPSPSAPAPPPPVRFYSMEFMANGSVEDLLRKDGRLPVERALPIVFDAARGLEYAERHGIVHRDIKPDNLMISEDGVVKIGDLGIATRRRGDGEASKEEGVSGSPHYMAPEQAMGRGLDHRADLYALGVSLYQMLAGETPFEGSSAREVILKHLNEQPPPLAAKCPHLAPEVVALVEHLMEKDPTRRLASASILLQELVPLFRRYPVADASRLRIDGIIAQRTELQVASTPARAPLPDTVPRADKLGAVDPKGETAALPTTPASPKPARRIPVSRAALVRLVLVLGSLALGVIAFSVVRKVREGAAAKREARQQLLRDARDAVAKDAVAGEKQARALAIAFDRDGWKDEALAASRIAKEAGDLVAQAEEKKRADAAAAAYREAVAKVAQAAAADKDPERIAYYELQVKLFGEVAEKFEGTPEAEHATRDREAARRSLEDAKEKKDARLADEARTRNALLATNDSLKALYREGRFEDANTLIDHFEQNHGASDLGKTATTEMRAELLDRGRAAVERVRRRSAAAAARKEWDTARTALKDVRLTVRGVKRLEDEVDAALLALDEIEKKEREDEIARKDDDARKAAEASAKKLIGERRFDEAASVFADASMKVRSSKLQQALDRRSEHLRLAGAAIKDIVATVQERHRQSRVQHDGAPAEDATSSKVQFHGPNGKLVEVTFAEVPAIELHGWAREAAGARPDPDALLHAAALAIVTGVKELAEADLAAVSDLKITKAQDDRLSDLRAWLDE